MEVKERVNGVIIDGIYDYLSYIYIVVNDDDCLCILRENISDECGKVNLNKCVAHSPSIIFDLGGVSHTSF